MYRVRVSEINKFTQLDLQCMCHRSADVSSFPCTYESITPLPSKDNTPWQAKHSLQSICVSYLLGPLEAVRERGTQDYCLNPSQLCCFTPF